MDMMAIIFDWFENPKHHEAEAPCTYAPASISLPSNPSTSPHPEIWPLKRCKFSR